MMRWRITICGKFQGVFYRKSTQKKALELGVSGWVRNLDNCCVEAEIEGTPEQIDAMVDWCNEGPPAAEVTSIDEEEVPVKNDEGFFIRYSKLLCRSFRILFLF